MLGNASAALSYRDPGLRQGISNADSQAIGIGNRGKEGEAVTGYKDAICGPYRHCTPGMTQPRCGTWMHVSATAYSHQEAGGDDATISRKIF